MTDPVFTERGVTVFHGDCVDVLRTLPDGSVDAVVTDPPYGLSKQPDPVEVLTHWLAGDDYEHTAAGFMGRTWDSFVPGPAVWRECLRVLKPGGHLLAFFGTRTADIGGLAIRLAGFEVRDTVAWMYGSGFPKSLDVSKAIDRQRHDADEKLRVTSWFADVAEANGVSRADVDAHMGTSDMGGWWLSRLRHRCAVPTLDQVPALLEVLGVADGDVPDDIRRLLFELNGRKGQPGEAWALREVIGSRSVPAGHGFAGETYREGGTSAVSYNDTTAATDAAKRWEGWGTALKPAFEPVIVARRPLDGTVARNVLEHGVGALNIDGCRVGCDGGTRGAGSGKPTVNTHGDGLNGGFGVPVDGLGRWPANVVIDEAAGAVLDEMVGERPSGARAAGVRTGLGFHGADGDGVPAITASSGGASRFFYSAKADASDRVGSKHPTVKPVDLMRWLVRLVTPPGGVVLDPFAGSGTTGQAAIDEGMRAVLVEREAEYIDDIRRRITGWGVTEETLLDGAA